MMFKVNINLVAVLDIIVVHKIFISGKVESSPYIKGLGFLLGKKPNDFLPHIIFY